MPLLEIRDLSIVIRKPDGTRLITDNVSFSIHRGETYVLLGESGCGKSITALSILQLLEPSVVMLDESQIILDNQDISRLSESEMRGIRGRKIAMIFQEPMTSLNPVKTVFDQISEVLTLHFNVSRKRSRDRVLSLLEQVGITDPLRRLNEYPHQLSGGTKQRVMIAMALACEPDILIADEPTTALDVTIQAQILALLSDLQKRTGMAILLITHDLGVVRQMADRIGVMYAGQLIEQADVEDFFQSPMHPYSQKLFASLPNIEKRHHALSTIRGTVPYYDQNSVGCRFANRCSDKMSVCEKVTPDWYDSNLTHRARCHLYSPDLDCKHIREETTAPIQLEKNHHVRKVLLKVDHLKVHFPIKKGILQRTVGVVRAVDDISFKLFAGKTLALVGESGCGKTTLGRAILQLITPTSGHVWYENIDLCKQSFHQLHPYRRDIQIIFQDPFSSMNPRLLIHDIISEGLIAFKLIKTEDKRVQRVAELLELVGLDPAMQWRYPHEFSGGQRQRIAIARALAVEPRIIICDEPTSALDISVQASILNLLKRLQLQFGYAYLFITHNLSVVAYLADDIAVMHSGRIVEHGSVKTILESPKALYTQKLLNAVPTLERRVI